ncbi:uncharacterized protein cd34 isoform X2 [Halichoeres trimaculatus]|uniref:uncharacterized protein cd34 isoform X2 n=1 Tax=Halichoeres trimaculatus TaxID=147232 RepID=UPI003D9F5683
MAAHMWRMNGLWGRMAIVLVLSALLLSNGVMCQDDAPDATDAPAADTSVAADADAAATSGAPAVTAVPDAGDTAAPDAAADSAATAAPGDVVLAATVITVAINPSGTDAPDSPPAAPEEPKVVKLVVPDVTCVGKDDIPESAVKVSVDTTDCEATKRIIQDNPAGWCSKENCNLKIAQEGKKLSVVSDDAKLATLADAFQSAALKEKLGVTNVETPSSSGSSVLAGILVSGLLTAIGITIGYFKCQRRGDAKGVRLAEEAYPADQENQGNTLVSVAPLNPPPETPEKPSVNGESPEAAKTEPSPPPTNGTSTAKTADTEL